MRISDWSSDVCSSDLDALATQLAQIEHAIRPVATRIEELAGDADNAQRVASLRETIRQQLIPLNLDAAIAADMSPDSIIREIVSACIQRLPRDERPSPDKIARYQSVAAIARDFIGSVSTEHRSFRSEEHTSELQSLMRTSYAGFCLK